MMFNSPLEQFLILPINVINIIPGFLSITISNLLVVFLLIALFLVLYFVSITKKDSFESFIIPTRWQLVFENLNASITSVIQDNIQSENKNKFFPIVSSIFFLILNLNLFGIIPYTFTISSELIVTFTISLSIFIGIHIIAAIIHKIKFFSLYFPSGVSVVLSLLLVPIELISFFFKPISLSIRLFANMMAGHTLLKVIAGFVWTLMSLNGFFSLIHYVPLSILVVLFILETGVAVIQAFVFAVLFCIYINDVLNLH